ncbi:MAG TPA: hypothetical protein ENG78_02865 [Acidiferrobacteraceae bacterium]|nr:hypothetical protein [Acidiferrobacteraceae bacterium]HEX19748.1 hypothetical protein [Acidiferrobacteraceae bacterium]
MNRYSKWLAGFFACVMVVLLAACSKSPETMCREAADKIAELKVKESMGKSVSEALISRAADSLKNNTSLMKQCAASATKQKHKCVLLSDSIFQARTACDWKWVQYTGT